MDDTSLKRSFIVACNRDRDDYQVPLALAECGMLETLVTDYYSSPLRAKLLPTLAHRQNPGIATSQTKGSLLAILAQVAGQKSFNRIVGSSSRVDKILGSKTRSVARHSKADLLLYSEHAFEAFTDPKLEDRKRILFSFHPHRLLIREILQADCAKFPEMDWEIKEAIVEEELEARENEELRRAHLALCASSFTKRSLVHAGKPATQVKVVPYGMPPVRVVNGAKRSTGECHFVFVGQGLQRKGVHHLIKVWNRLALPNAKLTLICYRLDPAITRLAGPNINLTGAISQDELDTLFATAHVFVMPSLIEGFGLVFLEAMAAGMHVIGSENTGLPDLKAPPELASICEAGNLDSLAAAVEGAYRKYQADDLRHDEIMKFASTRLWAGFRETLRNEVNVFMDESAS